MAGRKPKPTALRVLEGNPGKRKINRNEPTMTGIVECPEWLEPEAKKEWERLAAPLCMMGILTPADTAVFATYCQAWARWKETELCIKENGLTTQLAGMSQKYMAAIAKVASEFGLTPSSRTKLTASDDAAKQPIDEMDALLGS